jgi:hypothetical protein
MDAEALEIIGDLPQLVAIGILMSVSLLIQATVITSLQQVLAHLDPMLERNTGFFAQFGVLNLVVFCMVLMHASQMSVWAWFYWRHAGLPSLTSALYHSALLLTTMDDGQGTLPKKWLVLGAAEGLTGWIMFSWSTSAMFSVISGLATKRQTHLARARASLNTRRPA